MALKGIKVIEMAGLAPAPFAGKVLRDMGARVIRVDKARATNMDRLSHDKESIAVDLKQREGVDIVKRLTTSADVVIEPFRTGVMERLGLGPNVLCSLNPSLIYARLTGYGQHGPLSAKAGHDINYIGYSGVLSKLGRKGQKPHAPINLLADFAGGGLMCALAIVSALYQRQKQEHHPHSPSQRVIDCSMVEGSAYVASWLWTSRDIDGLWSSRGERGTSMLDGGYACYDTYETKDGKHVACGALEPQFRDQLLKGLGVDMAGDGDVEISSELLATKFKTKTRDEWALVFAELDACVSPVLDMDEAAVVDEHNRARKSFVTLDDGSYLPNTSWLDIQRDENEGEPRMFALPQPGQNTRAILAELGFDNKHIEQLVNDGVVEEDELSHPRSKL